MFKFVTLQRDRTRKMQLHEVEQRISKLREQTPCLPVKVADVKNLPDSGSATVLSNMEPSMLETCTFASLTNKYQH